MTERSIGGEHLEEFEGLVYTTARMYARQVHMDEEELCQELRVRVWRACQTFDPAKSRSLKRYVFSAVTNKIKDFKRDAARRAAHGVTVLHIEDWTTPGDFDRLYNFVSGEEVYARIDEGLFVLPASVTEIEGRVLVLLMMEVGKPEIALRLRLRRPDVEVCIEALRSKCAAWEPGLQADSSRVVDIAAAVAA